MPDIFSPQKRSEIMSLIRSKNTKPEIALRKLLSAKLHPQGYRYRLHYKTPAGRPDIVFVSRKVAVFVDGTFWHGHKFKERKAKLPATYWVPKIERNIQRDRETNRKLRKMGWTVVRIWEHDLKKKPETALKKVERVLGLEGK